MGLDLGLVGFDLKLFGLDLGLDMELAGLDLGLNLKLDL